MKRLQRLLGEFFFALRFYKNPIIYYAERLGVFHDKKITLRLRNGLSYMLNANTSDIRIINEIWHEGVYDKHLPYIKEDSTVIDIGTQIGVFSVKAAMQAKGVRVISYEPFPPNFETLERNIALNNLQNRIIACNRAIAGSVGELEFFVQPHDTGGGSVHPHGKPGTMRSIKVTTETLQDVFAKHAIERCDFMKIDCEGAEEDILLNAPRELFSKIKSMSIEWHEDHSRFGRKKFTEFLNEVGYETQFNQQFGIIYAAR